MTFLFVSSIVGADAQPASLTLPSPLVRPTFRGPRPPRLAVQRIALTKPITLLGQSYTSVFVHIEGCLDFVPILLDSSFSIDAVPPCTSATAHETEDASHANASGILRVSTFFRGGTRHRRRRHQLDTSVTSRQAMDPLEVAAVLATKNFSSLDEGPIENNEEKHYRGTSRYVDRYLHIIHDDELLRRTVALEISFHEDYNDGSAACRQSRHVTFLWRNIVDYGQPPMSDFDCTRMIIELERRPTCDEIPSSESAVTTTTTTSAEVTILQFTISILQRVHSYNMVLSADSRPSYDVVALQCRVAGVSKNHPFCDWGLGESYNRSHTHHHDQMQSLKEGGGRYQDSSSIIRGTSAERKTLLDDIADPVLFRHLQQASISNTRAKPSILGQVLWNYDRKSGPIITDCC